MNDNSRASRSRDRDPDARREPHPARALHVDRRFRPLPLGRDAAAPALSRSPGGRAGDDAVRAAGRLHAGAFDKPSSATCRAAALRSRSNRRWPSASSAKATASRWSCRAPGNRRSRRFSPAFRSASDFSARHGFSCSTTCASASESCRGWWTAAPCWRCRAAQSSRQHGRCRS